MRNLRNAEQINGAEAQTATFLNSAVRAPRSSQTLDCFLLISVAEELLNMIMNDGSRQFGELPQTVLWHELRDHIERLNGSAVTDFVTDNITEAWIDFSYHGYRFSVNDQLGDYWFFAADPNCPDGVLETILCHCKLLLGNGRRA